MDGTFNQYFIQRWQRYFPNAGLPIACFYADQVSDEDRQCSSEVDRCLICNVARVLEGAPYVYEASTPGCPGGKRYTGFADRLRPNFKYFLSCGIPGEMEGERYKKSPALVEAYLDAHPAFEAPAPYLVFKRWDTLRPEEEPLGVIFFAKPDVLSGLFTLANYDVRALDGVIAPMGSGCASIISHPYREAQSETPRCILGMFDVSARPCVPPDTLTFTAPMKRFREMVRNMDESFLITDAWDHVRSRI